MAAASVYVITHIDLIPPKAEEGSALLRSHAGAARAVPGVERLELLQHYYRKNHFELLIVFETFEQYEAYLAAPATVAFRTELHPMLGAPFDDRVHLLDEA